MGIISFIGTRLLCFLKILLICSAFLFLNRSGTESDSVETISSSNYTYVLQLHIFHLQPIFFAVKRDIYPCTSHEATREGDAITTHIRNFLTTRTQVVSFKSRLIYVRERRPVPVKREAEWVPETNWTFRRKQKFLSPARIPASDLPARRLITTLSYPGSFSYS